MKTAMILASLTALAISGNAMALNTAAPRNVLIDGVTPSGVLLISPNAKNTAGGFFGSCRYDAAWYALAVGVGTAQPCQIVEQKSAGHLSCNLNRTTDFASPSVSAAAVTCGGFDDNGELFLPGAPGITIAATEFAGLGVIGTVTFDGLLPQNMRF